MLTRSGFKTSDQVQGQGAGRSRKRSIHESNRESDKLLYEAESEYLGCNHTDFVKYLMQHWQLPLTFENNVIYHHNPSAAQHSIPAIIVHLSDIIANGLGLGNMTIYQLTENGLALQATVKGTKYWKDGALN